MRVYAFNVSSFRTYAQHLSWDEEAALRRLIDLYHVLEKPLPLDRARLHVLACCRTAKQRKAVDTVLVEFFTETPRCWANARFDKQIGKGGKNRLWEGRLDVSFGEWQALRDMILAAYSHRCAYCGNEARSVDHLVPLNRGGRSEPDNLLPACKPCNSSKGDKLYHEWRGTIQ